MKKRPFIEADFGFGLWNGEINQGWFLSSENGYFSSDLIPIKDKVGGKTFIYQGWHISMEKNKKNGLGNFRKIPAMKNINSVHEMGRPDSKDLLIGVRIRNGGMSFFKLPFSPLLSYLDVCEDLNAQACNY